MLVVRLAAGAAPAAVLALPVTPGSEGGPAALVTPATPVPGHLAAECAALLEQVNHRGRAGSVHSLPRPLERTRRVLLVGIGAGDEAGWRAAGAGLARAACRERAATLALPATVGPDELRGLVEGLLLASYRFRLAADPPGQGPQLRRVTLQVDDPTRFEAAVATAEAVAEATSFARDLTNTPSLQKVPAWFVRQVEKRADRLVAKAGVPAAQLRVRARGVDELRQEGFHAILAVGAGSASPPRLLEVSWRPRGARSHVVLVGKGITFDTGGISIKPAAGMKLMRKDMGGGAAVAAAVLGAARLRLPVRVTAVVPLAENMVSGSAQRPGDVIRHWGGRTSEVRNTDAEGRLVLADALAYAAARLRPDWLVDLATLTGANAVALGKRTAALYSDDSVLAEQLSAAAAAAGERVWRMPLVDDYTEALGSEVADLNNAPEIGGGSVLAALFLREFTGAARHQWAHFDMSAPSWVEKDDGELSRGATGWGVRTLLRWLGTQATPESEEDGRDSGRS